MAAAKSSRKRYVILPARGISGEVMQASVFWAASRPTRVIAEARAAFAKFDASSSDRHAELPSTLETMRDDTQIEVVSQFFEDGPAVVVLTDAGRAALTALHPDVRIVPLTRYQLADAFPAASAVLANGRIFIDDCKQFYAASGDANAGAGVIVGVVDTGVDASHPALQGKLAGSRSLVHGEDAVDGGPVDWRGDERAGHGTHVAAIIAGSAAAGGPAGVAPGARLVSYRVFPHRPVGGGATNQMIIDAIRAAIDDGCHIINLSLTGRSLREDGVRSAINNAWSNGVLCIAATGNDKRRPVGFPAALPNCVAVSAIGRDGSFPSVAAHRQFVSTDRGGHDAKVFLTTFSNVGPQVKFAAPGHAVVSAGLAHDWEFRSGTSMAAPFVSGVAAALLSRNGNVLNAFGDAGRSGAILQMLIARARAFGFSSPSFEGYGVPLP